jgi:hypothetical protein
MSVRTHPIKPGRVNVPFTIVHDPVAAMKRMHMSIRRDIRAIGPGAQALPAASLILNLLLISP